MGRLAEGWHLTFPPRGGGKPPIGHVRFTVHGVRVERSTGQTEKRKAAEAAANIYARALNGKLPPTRKKTIAGDGPALVDLVDSWLQQLPNPPDTVKVYEVYGRQWIAFFRTLAAISPTTIQDYSTARLKTVIRKTVRKELSKLRGFLRWCKKQGLLTEEMHVPIPERTELGTRHNPRRKIEPVPISEKEAAALRLALPETGKKWHGRQRRPRGFFTVLWETGLRPSTVHRLEVSRHYVKGGAELRITEDIDKIHYGRTISLTPLARRELDAACPKSGLIFPKADYRRTLKKAAEAAGLPPDKVRALTKYDFRHGRTTSLLRETNNLLGTAQLVGHKQVSTTNKYAHPDREAGDAVIAALSRKTRRKR